jgi:glutamate synthase domain-containing protein 3
LASIDCNGLTIKEINRAIKQGLSKDGEVTLTNPNSRHNLGVGLDQPGRVVFEGSVGYYCGGMLKQCTIEINGNAGWSVASDMQSGTVVVRGNSSACAGAAMRGGTLIVHGNSGPRTGISQKAGTIVIGKDVDYMSGFVMQRGLMVVCGDTGGAFADSIYEGKLFVLGATDDLGNDAIVTEILDDDKLKISGLLSKYNIDGIPENPRFKKIVSGKKLYNFDKSDFKLWRVAL